MKQLFTLFLGLALTVGYAQKKELKTAQKQFKATKVEEAKATLSANQALFEGSTDAKIKSQYHLLLGQIARLDKAFQNAFDNLKVGRRKSAIKATVDTEMQQLTSDIVNAAIEQSEAKDFIASSNNLFLAYQMNPEANEDYSICSDQCCQWIRLPIGIGTLYLTPRYKLHRCGHKILCD